MNYGVVVAGGIGRRMGADKPKQFLTIGNKPIIVHTVEKFVLCNELERIIVLTPEDWIAYTRDLLKKNLGDALMDRVSVVAGGETRNETIMNAIAHIEKNYGLDDDTVIVTHDAVRPFVTHRIIRDNIEAVLKYGATDTVVAATDTIVESQDGDIISMIPDRSRMYQGQTPQSFKARELRETYNSLTEEEKGILTDATKIYVLKGKPVKLVKGESFNIKITYPYDLDIAQTLLMGEDL
ncbi:MAG: 2-C-methyl-D-erythritol 4-phosphate cytidylyltransferase [Clostridiales bacterium]|nr:2-C-methyl-D-erythritol 4-phosphate cytidylyltransferase [Candidatus Crickella caballi]